MSTTSPDTLLRRMREANGAAAAALDGDDSIAWEDLVRDLMNAAHDLDESLSAGGALPSDWQERSA